MQRRSLLTLLLLAVPALAGRRRDNAEQCERIDARLSDIDAQRRLGYTPRRGRMLAAQREKLAQQRRDKCR
jgi:hypothetical protein